MKYNNTFSLIPILYYYPTFHKEGRSERLSNSPKVVRQANRSSQKLKLKCDFEGTVLSIVIKYHTLLRSLPASTFAPCNPFPIQQPE